MAELTSVANIKTHAGITTSADDALLATLLESAEALLRNYCNRPDGWTQAAFTETLDGAGVNTFTVRNTPVAASPAPVVKVTYGTSQQTINAARYRFDPEVGEFRYIASRVMMFEYGEDNGDVREDPAWSEGFQNIEVEYTGGYSSIPADLAQAAIEATLWQYYDRTGNKGMQAETHGAYNYQRWTPQPGGPPLPPSVTVLADPYRRGLA